MIVTATRAESKRLFATLTLAFASDPFVRWLFPQPDAFLANFPSALEILGGAAFEHGSADRHADGCAAALWLPPSIHPDDEEVFAFFERAVAADKRGVLSTMREQMDRHQPSSPFWHLAFIGVDPRHQGQRLGSALLDKGLARCDEAGQTASLQSSNPANIPFYQHHGFVLTAVIDRGAAPALHMMQRPPR